MCFDSPGEFQMAYSPYNFLQKICFWHHFFQKKSFFLHRPGSCPSALKGAGEAFTPDSFLFPMDDGKGGLRPLSYEDLTTALQHELLAVGYEATHYKGQSFRIGAATTMVFNGVPDHVIKDMGGWSRDSKAFYLYVGKAPQEVRIHMSAFLARAYVSYLAYQALEQVVRPTAAARRLGRSSRQTCGCGQISQQISGKKIGFFCRLVGRRFAPGPFVACEQITTRPSPNSFEATAISVIQHHASPWGEPCLFHTP
jgi:hypothetical protein